MITCNTPSSESQFQIHVGGRQECIPAITHLARNVASEGIAFLIIIIFLQR